MTVALQIAKQRAVRLVDMLRPACERIEIAGSIRRGKPEVNDIEIVAIPRWDHQNDLLGNLFASYNQVNELLDHWVSIDLIRQWLDDRGRPCWGPKFRKFYVDGIKVDLFQADADNFGLIYLIRTGPADFSKWLVTKQPFGACPPDMRVEGGRLWLDGGTEPVKTAEEEDVFFMFGLDFIPPEERTAREGVR